MADLDGFYTDLLEETAFATRAPLGIIIPPPVAPTPIAFLPPLPADAALDYVAQAKSRVITQYREATRLLAELTVLVGIVQEIENALIVVKGLDDYLNPAVGGVNLDVTGEIVGQPRRLSNGTDVTDTLYRTLITARIGLNSTTSSSPDVLVAIALVLGISSGIIYRDWGVMSIGYQIPRAPTSDEVALLGSDIIPRPMGVEMERSWYDSTNFFGFSANPSAHGYGVGKLATSF